MVFFDVYCALMYIWCTLMCIWGRNTRSTAALEVGSLKFRDYLVSFFVMIPD